MACSGSFAGSYFFWAFLSGCFIGFAFGRLTARVPRGDVRSRNWKWVAVPMYASLGVLLALAAAFVPSSFCIEPVKLRVSPAFLDLRILYTFIAGLVPAFAGLRFKRAVGIPLLVILSLSAAMAVSLKYPWRRAEPGVRVAEVRLLSIAAGKRSIEFAPDSGGTYFYELGSPGIQFKVTTLVTSDYYFFVDRPFMYRWETISAADGYKVVAEGSRTSIALPNHREGGSSFQAWLQRMSEILPGWDSYILTIEADRMLPFFRYGILLDGEGGPRIELMKLEH
jgi:hypothetical protein